MDPAQRAFYRFHSTRDGAVGRPGQRRLHRRHRDRRRARPQRPAPEPLLGHRRRPRRDGVGGRRHRHRPGQGRHEGPPAAGPHVPHRHGRRAASSTTRRSSRRSPPSTRTASGSTQSLVELDDLPAREHVVFSHDSVLRRQQLFGYTHEELKVILAPMAAKGTEPIGSMGTDTPIAVLSDAPAPAVRLLRAAVRPGHEPAARRHPRGGRHVGVVDDRARGQPAAAGAGELPPARAAVPDHRQRRAGQDRPRQRRRPLPRPAVARRQGPLPRRRWRPRARAGAGGDLPRGVGGDRRTAPASSCCRTATPTPPRRRSRRCC